MSRSQASQRTRKLIKQGRGALLEGDGVAVRVPDAGKVRPDGIPADAVAGLSVRFGFRWLGAASVARVVRELAARLPAAELRPLIAALEQLEQGSTVATSDAGVPSEKGDVAA